jgi:hypothetical protein
MCCNPFVSKFVDHRILSYLTGMVMCDNLMYDIPQELWALDKKVNAVEVLIEIVPGVWSYPDLSTNARKLSQQ